MTEERKKSVSKFLSFILRHGPDTIGLVLDHEGWADVGDLLLKSASGHTSFTREELEEVVATNEKQRFLFSPDNTKIRASQGHSIAVDLKLASQTPPAFLFHGTVEKFLPLIREEGLQKMERQHVHLSEDKSTAENVGSRRGKPQILTIATEEMHAEGFEFFRSDNGVWLTDHVPARFIKF